MEHNLAVLNEAIAAAVGDTPCIVVRGRTFTYTEVAERTRRLANALVDRGLGIHRERAELAGHESGQDHLALYLLNGNEYLEGMLGAYKARVAPFNVNFRYVEEELAYLLTDSAATAILYHSRFAPTLAAIRSQLPQLRVLLQVPDDSGHELLDGAEWYEDVLASSSDAAPPTTPSPDDLYILYTGGTTGMPKGVLWRQADIFPGALGGRAMGTGEEFATVDAVVDLARNGGVAMMPTPPFMHGAAHWMAFNAMHGGNALVLQDRPEHLDAVDVWSTIQREHVNVLLIVGDAFARPLVDELRSGSWDTSSLMMVVSGGAALSAPMKDELLELLPNVAVMDGLGSSEAGMQARQVAAAGARSSTGTFTPEAGMCIVSEDLTRLLAPGDDELGWLAQAGRVPLGYLGDPEKTARTFPIIDGVRYSVPGDRARVTADGLLELHGRDSVTINSGGEKIFAEEVEQALMHHPDVADAVVAGRPSERWGNEVVAIVALRAGRTPDEATLLRECERHIARYKLPKAFVFVDAVVRSPAGKADYRWAREQAVAATGT